MSLFKPEAWPVRTMVGKYGWRGVPYLLALNLNSHSRAIRVGAPGIRHPVFLRTRTTDAHVFKEVFLDAGYAFELRQEPKVIVDCGANIGLASIYYANRYPRARILAIEPGGANFEICRRNLEPYPQARALHAAVWSENRELEVYDPGEDHGAWGLRVAVTTPPGAKRAVERISGRTIDRLMAECAIDFIDLLKVDVEGAEAAIFRDASAWIGRVGVLVVECHDRFHAGCEASVRAAAWEFENTHERGNLLVFERRRSDGG